MNQPSQSRRKFIKQCILISCTVFAPSITLANPKLHILSTEDTDFLKAIIPVFLDGVELSESYILKIINNIDSTIHHMPLATQDELKQLFWLMRHRIFRVILGGIWQNWEQAKQENIHRLLNIWRQDELGVLDVAYDALHGLCLGAWYTEKDSWQAINYPGAPVIAA